MIIPKANDVIEYHVVPVNKAPVTARVVRAMVYLDMYSKIQFLVELDKKDAYKNHEIVHCGHILGIKEYSKSYPKKLNYLSEINYKRTQRQVHTTISQCVIACLENMNIEVIRPLSYDKIETVYRLTGYGLATKGSAYCPTEYIMSKKFKRWVRTNLLRFTMTVSEYKIHYKRMSRIEAIDYQMDFDEDMEDW